MNLNEICILKELIPEHELYLVTARQSEAKVAMQLSDFGWTNVFSRTFVTQQKIEKHSLIKNIIATSPTDWFIGDTGKDIETGKAWVYKRQQYYRAF